MQNRVQRQTKVKKTPLFVLLAMIVIVLCMIVMVFMNFIKEDKNSKSPNSLDFISTSSDVSSDVSSEASSAIPPQSSLPPVSSESSAVSSDPLYFSTEAIQVKTVVPQTVPVDDEYFKDALFIGDSISKALKLHGVVPDGNILADQNVGLDQIYNNKDVYYISAKVKTTLWKAIEKKMPKPMKIYMLLGSNGIPGYENEQHMEYYADLIDKLKEKFPEAIIYIQSVTPITKNSRYIRKTFSTAKINDFNKKLLPLVEQKGVYYLSVEDALKDKNGYLKAEYAADDGIHMQKAGARAIYDYYKSHTVTKEGVAIVANQEISGGG